MNAKTRLELLRALKRIKTPVRSASEGFTLVELMIVVAIVGILSAVALPQYLLARSRAEAGAAIGQAIGLAKECAVGQASRLSANVVVGTTTLTCDGTEAEAFVASWSGNAPGVRCLNVTIGTSVTSATITAGVTGTLSCA